jgi:hypothetical protein
MDGIFLGHNLLLSQAFFSLIELWLLHSLSHKLSLFYDGISAIRKPFSRTFFFFHDGISAITEPFSRTFFFFHDGISAITEPFSRTFFFFHDVISAITEPFSRTFFSFFYDGISAITKPFSQTFSFFKMEFWLSRSLSYELFLFSRWNSGYHEAFLINFFSFQDGILAITEPLL